MPSGQRKTESAQARVGQKFGKLLISEWAGSDQHRRAIYKCVCECGNECTKTWMHLSKATIPNCGCMTKVFQSDAHLKHGQSTRKGETRIYTIWKAIHKRCTNQNDKGFRYYGGKGVYVCDRWSEFSAFVQDMGPDPGSGFDLDRINPDGPYSPDNRSEEHTSELQ